MPVSSFKVLSNYCPFSIFFIWNLLSIGYYNLELACDSKSTWQIIKLVYKEMLWLICEMTMTWILKSQAHLTGKAQAHIKNRRLSPLCISKKQKILYKFLSFNVQLSFFRTTLYLNYLLSKHWYIFCYTFSVSYTHLTLTTNREV